MRTRTACALAGLTALALAMPRQSYGVKIKRVTLSLDAEEPDIDKLKEKEKELKLQVQSLQHEQEKLSAGVSLGSDFDESGYDIMSWTLAAFGGIMGLVLIFGGVRIPKTSTVIVVSFGMGAIGFSILWFGVAYGADTWSAPFTAGYCGGLIFGALFGFAAVSLPLSSVFTTTILGACSYMIFGIMLNTVGFFKVVSETTPAYFMFSIMAGTFFLLGGLIHLTLGLTNAVEKRHMALGVYSFVGSYLFIKCCGIAALKYPNEWAHLYSDPNATSWEYYTMFAMTFVATTLSCIFQFLVYRIGPNDEFAEGGVLSTSRPPPSSFVANNNKPTHGSDRRQFLLNDGNDQPEFGGAIAHPDFDVGNGYLGMEKYSAYS